MISEQTTALDYRRTKDSALQALARAGDAGAVQELATRGLTVRADAEVTGLESADLRRLVAAWRAGATPAERVQNRQLAERAHTELEVRYRVDTQLWERDRRGPAPSAPSMAPWLVPRAVRVQSWQRPDGSSCYPGPLAETRAALDDARRATYAALNTPAPVRD